MSLNNKLFSYVSLFAGIGGFDSALNKLGGQCVMASEIDKFAKQAYKAMYGTEPKGDITKIKSKNIPNHDILTAGFPCQSFSVAGKRSGMAYVCSNCSKEQTLSFNDYADRNFVCSECGGIIEPVDGRGLLFFEVARVARDKQPKALLLENVKGLVGHNKGRTLDTIVKTLNDIGYTIDFEVLNTKYFNLPQNRERIFIVAFRDDLVEATGWSEESRKGNTVVPKGKRRLHEYGNVKSFDFPFPENDTVTSHLIDVLETKVDEKYYLDEEKTMGFLKEFNGDIIVREATSKGYSIAKEGDSINISHPNSKTRRGRVGKQIANTLIASNIEQAVVESLPMDCEIPKETSLVVGNKKQKRVRKLMPLECWRLQGFSDQQHNAVEQVGISDSQRYKQAGNAVSVPVIVAIAERMLKLLNVQD